MNTLVTPHDPEWKTLFCQEKAVLNRVLGNNAVAIEHIGSTSIPNILAKPIIDILIEVDSLQSIENLTPNIQTLGYEVMGEFGIEHRRYFRKSNAQNIRTHHIHAYETGSPHLERHLAFRDYLIAHPEKAQQYSQIKAKLTATSNSKENYIAGKDPFIKITEQDAMAWYRSTP